MVVPRRTVSGVAVLVIAGVFVSLCGAMPLGWATADFSAARTGGAIDAVAFAQDLTTLIVGPSPRSAPDTFLAVHNVTVNPSDIGFAISAAPVNLTLFTTRTLALSTGALKSLGVSKIVQLVGPAPPEDTSGTNMWIIPVIAAGLGLAAAAVAVAEFTARGARARRKARQAAPASTGGMLSDN